MEDTRALPVTLEPMLALTIANKGIATWTRKQHVGKILGSQYTWKLIIHHFVANHLSHHFCSEMRFVGMIDDRWGRAPEENICLALKGLGNMRRQRAHAFFDPI